MFTTLHCLASHFQSTPRNNGSSAVANLPSPISDSASPASSNSPKFSSTQISSPTTTTSGSSTTATTSSDLAAEDDDLVVLPNEDTPLGIHVIPDYDENKVSQVNRKDLRRRLDIPSPSVQCCNVCNVVMTRLLLDKKVVDIQNH